MRRRRPKTKLKRGELFVRFEFWELETEAFQHLSADATRVYLFMHMRYDGSNNGAVVFSHRYASQVLRSDWRRAANALAELVHYGFIRCRTPGEPGPNIRPASEWQLTKFECGGQPASKTFARWDGTAFEPPYRSKAKKQLPTGNMPTPRLQHADASPPCGPDSDPKSAKSACNMPTPPPQGRLQLADTCRYTTQGGPAESGQKVRAAPSAPRARKPQSVYAGQPVLRLRAFDLMRSRNGPWKRSQIATELDVHPVRAGQALKELCDLGHAERIDHGRYVLTWLPEDGSPPN
jgi:hypothetical protein